MTSKKRPIVEGKLVHPNAPNELITVSKEHICNEALSSGYSAVSERHYR